MYRVDFQRGAKKDLDRLPKAIGDRLTLAIAALRSDPRRNAAKLAGFTDIYRIRIGSYRVIYQIRDDELLVLIIRVARRTERTYRDL